MKTIIKVLDDLFSRDRISNESDILELGYKICFAKMVCRFNGYEYAESSIADNKE